MLSLCLHGFPRGAAVCPKIKNMYPGVNIQSMPLTGALMKIWTWSLPTSSQMQRTNFTLYMWQIFFFKPLMNDTKRRWHEHNPVAFCVGKKKNPEVLDVIQRSEIHFFFILGYKGSTFSRLVDRRLVTTCG